MRARIVEREFALDPPFAASGWTLASRRCLYFVIEDEDGVAGVGESAPLEPFGTESPDRSRDALRRAVAAVSGVASAPASHDDVAAFAARYSSTPCARFAVECALLDLRARRLGLPLYAALGARGPAAFPVNAVVGAGDGATAPGRAGGFVAAGYSCVKLKVGAGPLVDDLRRVAAVRARVGPDVLLRLDANGAWDGETAREALARLADADIEYVEQPVAAADVETLVRIAAESPVPVVADEAVRDEESARALLDAGIDGLVLKPMALGSLVACRRLARDARARGRIATITSLVDSAVGRRAAAHLVASLPELRATHHGLATGAFFAADVARDPVHGGSFVLPDLPGIGLPFPW